MPSPGNILRLLTVAFIAVAAMSSAVLPSVHAQSPPDELLFLRATVDNDRPYLGQQMTYVARIYQNSGVTLPFDEVRYESPDFAGFWNSQLVEQDRYTETIDSEEYSVLELKTALFPTVVGTVVIDPAALTASTGNAGPQTLVESPPVPVEVRPLPVGAPSGFTGAVGRFSITADVGSNTGQVNEPVELTVTVSGEGNIEALPDPVWPEFTGWRVIESPADTASQLIAGQVAGSRTYEILLVPERAGELTIPGIGYTHFDPGQERYVEAATAAIVISVVSADGTAAIPPVPGAETVGEEDRPADETREGCAAVAASRWSGTDRKHGVLGRVGNTWADYRGRIGMAAQTGSPGSRPRRVPPPERPAQRPNSIGARRNRRG